MNDDWVLKTAQMLRERKRRQATQAVIFIEKQNLKRQHGPSLWNAVRDEVNRRCAALNTEMQRQILLFEAAPNSVISVRAYGDSESLMGGEQMRHLNATFNADIGRIEYDSGQYKGSFELSIESDGSGQFYSGMIPATPESIAREMLGSLLQ